MAGIKAEMVDVSAKVKTYWGRVGIMKIEDIAGLFDKIGSVDSSKLAIPEYSFPQIEFPPIEAVTFNPEDSIMGDIKRQIQEQNDLTLQQINILLEHNKL